MARCVQEELKNPGRKKGQKTRPTDFDEVFEDKGTYECRTNDKSVI